jgi:site-specific DNA recombinase
LTVGISALSIDVRSAGLAGLANEQDHTSAASTDTNDGGHVHSIILPMRLGRRGNETRLIIQSAPQKRPVDQRLLNLIARGYVWREQIVSGSAESASSIGDRDGVSRPYVSRLIDLSFLAPDIIVAMANGTAPADLSSEKLQSIDALPLDWASQRAVLGFGR